MVVSILEDKLRWSVMHERIEDAARLATATTTCMKFLNQFAAHIRTTCHRSENRRLCSRHLTSPPTMQVCISIHGPTKRVVIFPFSFAWRTFGSPVELKKINLEERNKFMEGTSEKDYASAVTGFLFCFRNQVTCTWTWNTVDLISHNGANNGNLSRLKRRFGPHASSFLDSLENRLCLTYKCGLQSNWSNHALICGKATGRCARRRSFREELIVETVNLQAALLSRGADVSGRDPLHSTLSADFTVPEKALSNTRAVWAEDFWNLQKKNSQTEPWPEGKNSISFVHSQCMVKNEKSQILCMTLALFFFSGKHFPCFHCFPFWQGSFFVKTVE